ncbi:MAG TPA: hypothetical protein VM307_10320 [Egibacteraceae bacterium]|nr:hypothetical protein [Egibacteraceae bacterium]
MTPGPGHADHARAVAFGGTIETYRVYGVDLASEDDLGLPLPRSQSPARVLFALGEPPVDIDLDRASPRAASISEYRQRPDFSFLAFDHVDVVRVHGAADYYLLDDRIVCHLVEPRHAGLVRAHLFGMVLALWLERRGVLTVHASAVAVGGNAVAFMAGRGHGKTSLSAALTNAGCRFLTDDLLALTRRDGAPGGFDAHPAYPQVRMTSDQARQFGEDPDGLPVVNPTTRKRGVAVPPERFSTDPAPVRRVYLPERTADADAVTIDPISPREAFPLAMRHSFLGREVADLGLRGEQFTRVTHLVATTAFRRIRYRSGWDVLPDVVDAIITDVHH